MSVLHIKEIFSRFEYYQAHYLDILQNPDLYYQPVLDAHIHFAAFSEEKIYLGDLLQLWFGYKWTAHQLNALDDGDQGLRAKMTDCQCNSLFFFAIERKGLFSQASALAWSTQEQQIKKIPLGRTLPYYCHYLSLERPRRCS